MANLTMFNRDMKIDFYKFQGAGNDFVLIDNRNGIFDRKNNELVKKLCDRRFGIGADGLMLVQPVSGYDFEMVYFNSDGNESSMCGNGGRCIVAFAYLLGIISAQTSFLATDGPHDAVVEKPDYIRLKMSDVKDIEYGSDYYYLNTGSPHFVKFVDDISKVDVFTEGRKIRYNERFKALGTNVNFVQFKDGKLFVRTYERGVEDETLACGTGITASSIAASEFLKTEQRNFEIIARGGELKVSFEKENTKHTNIWLTGPAKFVFKGTIEADNI